MIRLSIQARQALAKLTPPVLVAATFGIMWLGKADALLAERARMALGDTLAPIYASLSAPLSELRKTAAGTADLWDLRAENARLRAENDELRRWQSVALTLDAENRQLKAQLHWIPDPSLSFATARVVADAGGVYARAVLVSTGPNHSVRRGEIVIDGQGLVGRVTEVGDRTARVLLITDLNSRIPVVLGNSGGHAIVAGTNGPSPRLVFWQQGPPPQEGEHVVTSAEADAFPPNLPVGTVHYANHVPEVVPAAPLDTLSDVKLVDFSHGGVSRPEAAQEPRKPQR